MAGANSQRGAASGPSSNILIFWHTPWGPLCISIFEEFDRIHSNNKIWCPASVIVFITEKTSAVNNKNKERFAMLKVSIDCTRMICKFRFVRRRHLALRRNMFSSIKKLSPVPVCMPIMGDCIHTNCRQAFQIRPLACGFIR